jgi:hypothetical protein
MDEPLVIACGMLLLRAPPGGTPARFSGQNGPALPTPALFALAVMALIPAVKPDVPVVAPGDCATTAHVNR